MKRLARSWLCLPAMLILFWLAPAAARAELPEFGRCTASSVGNYSNAACTEAVGQGGKYEWTPLTHEERTEFISTTGPVHQVTEHGTIVCESGHAEGTTTGPKTSVARTTYEDCDLEGVGECHSQGAAAGVITGVAPIELGLINEATGSTGVDFKPPSGEIFAYYECEDDVTVTVKGSVIGVATPTNTMSTTFTTALEANEGKTANAPESFEGAPKDILESEFSQSPGVWLHTVEEGSSKTTIEEVERGGKYVPNPIEVRSKCTEVTKGASCAGSWIVSVGDSFISGEGGRWAGNTSWKLVEPLKIDALGFEAYFGEPNEEPGGEAIPLCHRSKSAEIFIGGSVRSKNLACSGARSFSFGEYHSLEANEFKPGLDFEYVLQGNKLRFDKDHKKPPETLGIGTRCPIKVCEGQALQLQGWAKTHDVKMIVVSIGGNNFNFGPVLGECYKDYDLKKGIKENYYCSEEKSVTKNFGEPNVKTQEALILEGLRNVGRAMLTDGYQKNQFTILVQDYPSIVANEEFREGPRAFRYPQRSLGQNLRQNVGGCGFWTKDAAWADKTAGGTIDATVFKAANALAAEGYTVRKMQLEEAFDGRRLCETGLQLVGETNVPTWEAKGAVNESEWVNQLRVFTAGTAFYQQEGVHPNYWGQLALRNCVRQAYNNGSPTGGTCKFAAPGLTEPGTEGIPEGVKPEPRMQLAPPEP
jgi:hypothetical protein